MNKLRRKPAKIDHSMRDAVARGAAPITVVMRGEHGRLQRHATYRLPATHGDQHLIDQMAGHGALTSQQHQNASALLYVFRAAGLDPATSARYSDRVHGHDAGGVCWMTIYCDEMARMSAAQSRLIGKMLRGECLVLHDLNQICVGLDKLDALGARYDVRVWADQN